MVVLAAGVDSVTLKPWSGSTTVSPAATSTVIVWLVWPAAKLTVPEGLDPTDKVRPSSGIGRRIP